MTHIQDLTCTIVGCVIFRMVDLVRAYNQIPEIEEDVARTAVLTPFGLFEFVRMPSELRNATQAFQRLMDQVCCGLDFVYVYLKDILVASSSEEKHRRHLSALFDRIAQHGFRIYLDECSFGENPVEFLGRRLTASCIEPSLVKTQATLEFPEPSSLEALHSFLDLFNFHRRFITQCASKTQPLSDLLRRTPKSYDFTEKAEGSLPQIE